MSEGISSKTIWNDAARTGLILGIVTIALQGLTQWLSGIIGGAVLKGLVEFVLWATKFATCILLMRLFMKNFVKAHPESINKDTRHYGEAIAVLSAFIVAAYTLVYYLYINPDVVQESMDMIRESYSSFMTGSQLDEMENAMADLPVISFFTVFIYCSLYGTLLSGILSNNIPARRSIFDEPDEDEQ